MTKQKKEDYPHELSSLHTIKNKSDLLSNLINV